jgi:hypothetical protein
MRREHNDRGSGDQQLHVKHARVNDLRMKNA